MKKVREKLQKLGIIMLCAGLILGNGLSMSVNATSGDSDSKKKTSTEKDNNDDTEEEDKNNNNSGNNNSTNNNNDDDDYRVSSTSEFLIVGDCVPTPSASYGQAVHLIIPIYNLGLETVTNLIITPLSSTSPSEWPFAMDTTGLVQVVDFIPASPNKDIAYQNRREVEWDLRIRKDAMTGCYPLTFNVSYYRGGDIETATLTSYINVTGAQGAGSLSTDEEGGASSTPRIIVTGFTTKPEEIYAGDTFDLTIHLENTAKNTAVTNIMFDLEAATEGSDENTTYSAFLPTSGSSTIFKDRIGAGQTTDIQIEMTAKADLAQKPYMLDIKMDYEDEKGNAFSATSNVSIPIKQNAKFEISTIDVLPDSISVGSETNVMFSIYNTGKTTLYNVQVAYEAESVSGGETFIGKIEPGGTGSVDSMVSGEAATTDEGKVKVLISYEDESGEQLVEEREMILFVTEDFGMDDMGEWDGMDVPEENEKQGSSKWLIIVVVIIIVVAAIVGFLIFFKKKKNKKDEDDLLDDIDDLFEDDTDPTEGE